MSNFKQENRYLVVKLKNLSHEQRAALFSLLEVQRIDPVAGVVVEHDWPEYKAVWGMLEARAALAGDT